MIVRLALVVLFAYLQAIVVFRSLFILIALWSDFGACGFCLLKSNECGQGHSFQER